MKLSLLKAFLKHDISANQISEEIKNVIGDYKKLLSKKGSTIPIKVTEDIEFSINKQDVIVLCQAFLDQLLEEYEVNYLVDVLQLSENVNFESEELFDYVSILTDPKVNGELKNNIDEVMQYCSSYK